MTAIPEELTGKEKQLGDFATAVVQADEAKINQTLDSLGILPETLPAGAMLANGMSTAGAAGIIGHLASAPGLAEHKNDMMNIMNTLISSQLSSVDDLQNKFNELPPSDFNDNFKNIFTGLMNIVLPSVTKTMLDKELNKEIPKLLHDESFLAIIEQGVHTSDEQVLVSQAQFESLITLVTNKLKHITVLSREQAIKILKDNFHITCNSESAVVLYDEDSTEPSYNEDLEEHMPVDLPVD